ncbi:hypothetical protein CSUI_006469 [Cystoisospora suis]|uniref:Uncharacterized protein n=1 Tax=Cystoisospora suis TaxID=483139 RepID=A0A2C6KUA0_9APIC|nr:hypothetical protein CSUI_006469 [Cystoisospora suis]
MFGNTLSLPPLSCPYDPSCTQTKAWDCSLLFDTSPGKKVLTSCGVFRSLILFDSSWWASDRTVCCLPLICCQVVSRLPGVFRGFSDTSCNRGNCMWLLGESAVTYPY